MAQAISINGTRLDKVRMLLVPWSEGTVSYLSYPKTQVQFSIAEETLRLAVPPLLGMELYRSGVLPQDCQVPVTISIGGRRRGRFVVVDVRYPGGCGSSTSDHVLITLARAGRRD
jgi:hypothetical protein